MHATQRRPPSRRVARERSAKSQRGAIAIIVGLSMIVMIGALGLAIDGGRLYLSKTETQNAADACALAASLELTGAPNIPVGNFPIAEAAGRVIAKQNRTRIQSQQVVDADITVAFGTALDGGSWVSAGSATPDARYVRCTIREAAITPYFMQVLGIGDQEVTSVATATLAPSQGACTAIPVGVCAPSPGASSYGLTPGQWITGTYGSRGQMTGNFGWLDYSPPSGGASELAALLRGTGACTVAVGSPVGQTGAIASLRVAWNTRFGVYAPSEPSSFPGAAVPDRSGYSYYTANWNRGTQGPALPDFLGTRRPANAPYGTNVQNGNAITGLGVGPNGSTVLQSGALASNGGGRRVVPSPIIDCAGFASSQTVNILAWGCILMLHPINQGGGSMPVNIEYIGLATDPGSPCATVGGVGDDTSTGPKVPALVQ